MEEVAAPLPSQSFDPSARHLQSSFTAFHQSHTHQPHQTSNAFTAHLDPALQALDPEDAFTAHFGPQLESPAHEQHLQVGNGFARRASAGFEHDQAHTGPSRQRRKHQVPGGGQFAVLVPQTQAPNHTYVQHEVLERIQQENDLIQMTRSASGQGKKDGHFADMKMIPNPPNLQTWRERLFHVNETITLSEEEYMPFSSLILHQTKQLSSFLTYFPHVDNIYSHRSTQRYKRKPFVSHYWDCRLKGRPSGTPKSDDPTKKKRKRQARGRDLCDVKIKITEYFPGARTMMGQEVDNTAEENADSFFGTGETFGQNSQQAQLFGIAPTMNGDASDIPGANGERYYTVQRVNGNGGNGKGDGVAGPHKHTLEESDRVKKNSIQRQFAKVEKERKKTQVRILVFPTTCVSSALSTILSDPRAALIATS